MEYMETEYITKINKALKKIDFKIVDDDRQLFYQYMYEKDLKLYNYDVHYPKYFKFLYFSIFDKLE
jgi:hypothetical protein